MNLCEYCGAKPGRGGVILRHKRGCTKDVLPTPEEVVMIQAEKIMMSFVEPVPVERKCLTCAYRMKPGSGMDECHRYPPDAGRWGWVAPGDWCGEWKEKKGE